jgi:hypothetical protein
MTFVVTWTELVQSVIVLFCVGAYGVIGLIVLWQERGRK